MSEIVLFNSSETPLPIFKKKYRIEIYIFYDVTHRIVGKVWEVEQPIKRCDADT